MLTDAAALWGLLRLLATKGRDAKIRDAARRGRRWAMKNKGEGWATAADLKTFAPIGAVKVAIADGFCNVVKTDLIPAGQIGDCACHFQDALIGAG